MIPMVQKPNGDFKDLQGDASGNANANLATLISGEDQDNNCVVTRQLPGTPTLIQAASAAQNLLVAGGVIERVDVGVLEAGSSISFYDGTVAGANLKAVISGAVAGPHVLGFEVGANSQIAVVSTGSVIRATIITTP